MRVTIVHRIPFPIGQTGRGKTGVWGIDDREPPRARVVIWWLLSPVGASLSPGFLHALADITVLVRSCLYQAGRVTRSYRDTSRGVDCVLECDSDNSPPNERMLYLERG